MVGCTPVEPADAPAPAPKTATHECTVVPDRDALPVVTTIQTRDHEITVHASDHGLRFTVSLAGGVVLGHQLTEGEFEQSFPGLHQRFSSAFAGDEAWLDARVTSPPHALSSAMGPPGLR